MRRDFLCALAIAGATACLAAAACSDSANKNSNGSDPDGGASSSSSSGSGALADGGDGFVATRAQYGLDTRTANPTCKAPPRPASTAKAKLEPAFTNVTFHSPMAMVQPPGDGSRWFVAQRDGVIVSFPTANPTAQTTVADVAQLSGFTIPQTFEGGFLNFVFHPAFATNGKAYVSFTTDGASGGYSSEVGYLTSSNGGASFSSYTRILQYDRPRLEHNGGGLAFGKDGFLYVGFGDGANDANAQNKDVFFGKILRLDVDNVPAGKTYGIPADNPFVNGGGKPEIFAWGFRNPFRFSIDRATGELWEGDVGNAKWEEINRVERGANYGWPCREGDEDYLANDPSVCPSKVGLIDPIVKHEHPAPNSRSITGGIVYRGKAMPAFQGTYVYADFIQLEAWAMTFDVGTGEAKTERINADGPVAGFSNFSEDIDGEIYVLALFQDQAFKLVPVETPDAGVAPPFPDMLSKTGCVDPMDAKKPAAGLIPYGVNAPLWSDGAEKERWVALPDGTTMVAGADGDLELPVGSVLVKTFWLGDKRVETRLFVHHDDGDWGGYSYEWNEDQTDATLLPSGKSKLVGDKTWTYPSRSECMRCHTKAAGRSLGLELGQLNGDFVYAETGRISNQLETLEHIGVLPALGKTPPEMLAYAGLKSDAPIEAKARAYLQSNCSNCHRPNGGAGRADMDLRYETAINASKTCGVAPILDDLGIPNAKLIVPGSPESSVLALRMHATDSKRMPPLGRVLVDQEGAKAVDDWIRGLTACP